MGKLLFILFLSGLFVAFKPVEETGGRTFATSLNKIMRPERVTAAAAVQTANNNTSSSTTLNVTVSSTGVDNLVTVAIFCVNSVTVTSVTDDQSNTYTVSTNLDFGASARMYQAYGVQTTGGVTTVTVTISAASGNIRAVVNEFSGTATSSVYDNGSTGTGTGTAVAVTSFSPAAAGKLVVAAVGSATVQVLTAGTDYTHYGTNANVISSMYRLSSSTSETAPGTLAGSTAWAEIASSFNLAAPATNTGGFFFKP